MPYAVLPAGAVVNISTRCMKVLALWKSSKTSHINASYRGSPTSTVSTSTISTSTNFIAIGTDNGHPERAFFQKCEFFGLGQTNLAEILGDILAISSQTIGTILAL